jgi:hypothetical protein
MTDRESSAGELARDFIAAELEVERSRKASFESRGFAVITTSGVLVTLLFGLAALVTSRKSFIPPDSVRWLLSAAAGFFVAAAALGIRSNAPARYLQVQPDSLAILVTPEVWGQPGADAGRELTAAQLTELEDARARNQGKGRIVLAAMALQLVAILLTTAAISVTLLEA